MSGYAPLSPLSPFNPFDLSVDNTSRVIGFGGAPAGAGGGAGAGPGPGALIRTESNALLSYAPPPPPPSAVRSDSIGQLFMPPAAAAAPTVSPALLSSSSASASAPALSLSTPLTPELKRKAFEQIIRKEKPRVNEKELVSQFRTHVTCRLCDHMLSYSRTKERTWSCGHSIHLRCLNGKTLKPDHCGYCDQKASEISFEEATRGLIGSVVFGPCKPQKKDRIDVCSPCREVLPVGDKQAWLIHREVCVYGIRPCSKCHKAFTVRAMRDHQDQCAVCPLGCGAIGSRESIAKHDCLYFEYQPPLSSSGSPPEVSAGAGAGAGNGTTTTGSESRKRKTPSPPTATDTASAGAGAGAGTSGVTANSNGDAPALKRMKLSEPPVASLLAASATKFKPSAIAIAAESDSDQECCHEPGCHWKGKSVKKHAAKKHIKSKKMKKPVTDSTSSESDADAADDGDGDDD